MAYKILSACGSGIATSSHVRASIMDGMADRGVDVDVRTCGITEISGLIDNLHPDMIVATTTVDEELVPNLGDIKVMSGVPLLTGVGKQQLFDEMQAYFESME